MKRECCFCREPVLGIAGQDCLLDSFNFQETAKDEAAAEQGIFGDCHLKCLAESNWNDFWHQRRVENFANVRQYVQVHKGNGTEVYRHESQRYSLVSPAKGMLLQIDDRELRDGLDAKNRSLTLREKERWWQLPAGVHFSGARDFFAHEGKLPLLELAELYDVRDRLFDLKGAARSRLWPTPGTTDRDIAQGVVVANVTSVISLRAELTAFLRNLLT